jgi:hypothetical protein
MSTDDVDVTDHVQGATERAREDDGQWFEAHPS